MSDSKNRLLSFSVKDILGSDKKLNLLYKNPLTNAESLIHKGQFKSAIEIYSRIQSKISDQDIQEKISRNISDLRDIVRRENPELEKSIPNNLKPKSIDLPLKELSESLGGSLTEKLNILKQIETVPEKEVPKKFPYDTENLKPDNFQNKPKYVPEENLKTEFIPVEINIDEDNKSKVENLNKIRNIKQDKIPKKEFESIDEKEIDKSKDTSKNENLEINPADLDKKLDSLLEDSFSLKKKEEDENKPNDLKSKSSIIESEIYFSEDSNLDKIELLEEEFIAKKKTASKKSFQEFEGFLQDSDTDDYFEQIINPARKKSSTFEEEFLDINPQKRKKSKGKSFVESIVSNSDLEEDILKEFGSFIKNKIGSNEVVDDGSELKNQQTTKSEQKPISKNQVLLENENQISEVTSSDISQRNEKLETKKQTLELNELQNEIESIKKIDKQIQKDENIQPIYLQTKIEKEIQKFEKTIETVKSEISKIPSSIEQEKLIIDKENSKFVYSESGDIKETQKNEKLVEVVKTDISPNQTVAKPNEIEIEKEIYTPPQVYKKEFDINDKLSSLYFSDEFQNFKSLPFKDRRSGKERRIKKTENFKNEKRSGEDRRVSIPDKLKKRAEFLKQWEENYLNQLASSPVPESILDTPAFPNKFKEIEFLPTDAPIYKSKEVPTSKLETLDLPDGEEKKEIKQKQEDFSKPPQKEVPQKAESIPANTELVFKDEISLVKIDLPEATSLNISGEKTAENQNPKNELKQNKKSNEDFSKPSSEKKDKSNIADSGFEIREIDLLKLDLPDPKDYVRSKSGHLVDPFEEKEAPEINIGDTEFPEDLPSSEEVLPEISGLPEIQEEPKEQEKIIHGVLELKPPEIDDAPFLTLTYDFSKIPHSYKLSKNYNIMEYSYYKYKPMLMKAQEFARRKMLKNALNYYRVIKSQNIPPELKKMISRNIIDITEFLEKFTMSKGG